jgi:outer membrane protein OmpA-like peptidoglycan-associated protein
MNMRKGMRRAPLLLAGLGFFLAGCATSSLDEMNNTQPSGSAFNQALFQDYAFLARSFGPAPSDSDDSFLGLDFSDGSSDPNQLLVQAFADKALLAAKDNNVEPEAAPDAEAAGVRARLVEALDATRESFPVHAARAQADYDCWILNASVAAQAAASAACHTSLMSDLARLERDLHPLPAYTPVAAAPIAAPTSDYTILFEFDSWTLTAEDLAVLTQAVNTARQGGQSRITIVGHTDTSGDAAYNRRLSLRRAKVAMEAMIDMGARRAAIDISGVGKSDLAVQTGDGVREAKNRRDVITLLP